MATFYTPPPKKRAISSSTSNDEKFYIRSKYYTQEKKKKIEEYKESVKNFGYRVADEQFYNPAVENRTFFRNLLDSDTFFVQTSQLQGAGLGVFTNEDIQKNTIIGIYGGDWFQPSTTAEKRQSQFQVYSNLEYAGVSENVRSYIMMVPVRKNDSTEDYYIGPSQAQVDYHQTLADTLNYAKNKRRPFRGTHFAILKNMHWSGFMNDAQKSGGKNNVVLIKNGYLKTTRKISKNSELYLEYGWRYWFPSEKGVEKNFIYVSQGIKNSIKLFASAPLRELKMLPFMDDLNNSSDDDTVANTEPLQTSPSRNQSVDPRQVFSPSPVGSDATVAPDSPQGGSNPSSPLSPSLFATMSPSPAESDATVAPAYNSPQGRSNPLPPGRANVLPPSKSPSPASPLKESNSQRSPNVLASYDSPHPQPFSFNTGAFESFAARPSQSTANKSGHNSKRNPGYDAFNPIIIGDSKSPSNSPSPVEINLGSEHESPFVIEGKGSGSKPNNHIIIYNAFKQRY